MLEGEISPEEIEAFREDYRTAMEGNIEILISGQTDDHLETDPFSLGLSDETMAELDPTRIRVIQEELRKLIGRTDETQPVSLYESGEENKLAVAVFEGQQQDSEGNMKSFYMHEIKHPDGNLDWQLSTRPDPVL